MWDNAGEVKLQFNRIVRVCIRTQRRAILPPFINIGIRITRTTFRPAFPRAIRIAELCHARAHVVHCHLIKRKDAGQRAPLGCHVGDRHPCRHGKLGDAVAQELHRMIEHFVLIGKSAQSDDDILARNAGRKVPL